MYWELPCVSIAIYYKHFVLYVYRVLLPENKRVVNYHSTLRILDNNIRCDVIIHTPAPY